MQSIRRIEHYCWRPRAGERGRDLRADVPGLADSHYHDFAARLDRLFDDFNHSVEIFVQTIPNSLVLKNFYVQYKSRLYKVVHRTILCGHVYILASISK